MLSRPAPLPGRTENLNETAPPCPRLVRTAGRGPGRAGASHPHRHLFPIGLLGLLFQDAIDSTLRNMWITASMLLLFALLFCWVSVGFWTALMGFFTGQVMRATGGKADPQKVAEALGAALKG